MHFRFLQITMPMINHPSYCTHQLNSDIANFRASLAHIVCHLPLTLFLTAQKRAVWHFSEAFLIPKVDGIPSTSAVQSCGFGLTMAQFISKKSQLQPLGSPYAPPQHPRDLLLLQPQIILYTWHSASVSYEAKLLFHPVVGENS